MTPHPPLSHSSVVLTLCAKGCVSVSPNNHVCGLRFVLEGHISRSNCSPDLSCKIAHPVTQTYAQIPSLFYFPHTLSFLSCLCVISWKESQKNTSTDGEGNSHLLSDTEGQNSIFFLLSLFWMRGSPLISHHEIAQVTGNQQFPDEWIWVLILCFT